MLCDGKKHGAVNRLVVACGVEIKRTNEEALTKYQKDFCVYKIL